MSDTLTHAPSRPRPDDACEVRVVELVDGKWRVRQPGALRASAVLDSRAEAEARAKEILRRSGGGEIHIRDAYGELTVRTVASDVAIPGRRQITRQPRTR